MRKIYVPGIDQYVSLGQYVSAVKKAKANMEAEFDHSLCHWASCRGYDIVKEFVTGMQDRINQGIAYNQRGV